MSNIRLVGGALRELRIHLCQKSSASSGVREFIMHDYVPLKKANSTFPILIRECSGITPRIWARYEHGKETSVSLENASREQDRYVMRKLVFAEHVIHDIS
ncbi:hypothetical protein AB6A40_010593 [Gnathostoma spinigerum]|uniref:NADH dehydrogenase [ubiquinone] 1 alpha subcomplex subunit 2 n=1 Tax=Gnathostoma spinigerum TaxID=75299 RepID=A0ABD6F1V4_9BILA